MYPAVLPGNCPVCGQSPLIPLAIGLKLLVEKSDKTAPVGGVLPYQCAHGHVFFVMLKDVNEAATA